MKLKSVLQTLLLIAFLAGGLQAATADNKAQAGMLTYKGTINSFDLKRKELVVDDDAYVVDNKTPVKTASGLPTTTGKLRPGRQVELLMLGNSVQEIRILK